MTRVPTTLGDFAARRMATESTTDFFEFHGTCNRTGCLAEPRCILVEVAWQKREVHIRSLCTDHAEAILDMFDEAGLAQIYEKAGGR